MDNINNEYSEKIDSDTIIECYKILIDKLSESNDLYKKIVVEKQKTIDLLKEKIDIMEEIDKVKDERIEILTNKLMRKGIENGISSESG